MALWLCTTRHWLYKSFKNKTLKCSCGKVMWKSPSGAKGCGSNSQETHMLIKKYIDWIHCKSLKRSAKCINVNGTSCAMRSHGKCDIHTRLPFIVFLFIAWKKIMVSRKILSSTTVFSIDNYKCFLSSKSVYWFLKDHVTLETGVHLCVTPAGTRRLCNIRLTSYRRCILVEN